tara:strand:- start:2172 stop:3371 length:1200 start_codon:yes stop_codon:yes gene_type:complete
VRKAQGGLNAAILVAVIAGLIILYILFLPEAEREALLENKSIDSVSGGSSSSSGGDFLLREFPGRLDNVEGVLDKTIPNIFLFETTNAKELESINPLIVRNGWFDEKKRSVSFGIDDLENTDNIILSFNAKEHEGILTIKLNNEIIYENEIVSQSVAPIRLNENLLTESSNTLEFSVSSVGARFWKTNEYSLDGIRIIGDITDRSKQESRNVFTLTSTDVFNIERADLRFVPYCRDEEKVGVLDVLINSREVFSAVPVCEDSYRQPIPLGVLNEGENRVIFRTNKGSYSVEQIKVEFVEKDTRTKVYFFEMNQTDINRIESGNKEVILTIEFVDDGRDRRADLNINDRLTTIDTDEKFFTKTLNDGTDPDFVEEGNNFVEIRPRTRLDIVEITVELENT